MLSRRIFRLTSLFSQQKPLSQKAQDTLPESQQTKVQEIPVYLKEYDKKKFQVPSSKIKRNSGYAMVQIEPFPRARIMKICYHILQKCRIQLPPDYLFRIYTEQKIKYVMKLVDEEEDIQKLERDLGGLPIEMVTRKLADTLDGIDVISQMRPWEEAESEQFIEQLEDDFVSTMGKQEDPKYPAYRKGERIKRQLI